jgi:hypothetical protein
MTSLRSFSIVFPGRERPLRARYFLFLAGFLFPALYALPAQAQSTPSSAWTVSIVLPPKIVAGKLATLAVIGVHGRLASGVTVTLGRDQNVITDGTGRASFTAPSDGTVLLATASGASAAALIDPPLPATVPGSISIAPIVSIKDQFSICGGGFSGDADADHVQLNGETALTLAGSPECLVVLAGPKSEPGITNASVESGGAASSGTTTLVSLNFEPPSPALIPDRKSRLVVRVEGSSQQLAIVVENQTPGVLEFLRGDTQELRTSGGAENLTMLDVQTVRSGDFTFHARLLRVPDPDSARRFLEAAEALAPKESQHAVRELADRIAHHPRDAEKVRWKLEEILRVTTAGDFRTLLDAAYSAL